ncbi:MAG: hypothetical protein ACPLZY_03795, partial [Candidatus Norongarragalinales archaeon]
MEYEAEFVEALNSYFPPKKTSYVSVCGVRPKIRVGVAVNVEITFPRGGYHGGVDISKLQGYSVLTVLKREADILKLVYMYQFPSKHHTRKSLT